MLIKSVLARLAAAVLIMTVIAAPATAMTGGQQLPQPGVAPWLATLALRGPGPLLNRASCGGVLVAPDRVLTAAHCFDGVDPTIVEVHIGSSVLSRDPGQVRLIQAAVIDPDYQILPSPAAPNDLSASSAKNDLAVIILDSPVEGTQPVPLAGHRLPPGATVALYSHGLTADPRSATGAEIRGDVLRRGKLTVISHEQCAAQTPATVDPDSIVCAQDLHGGGVTMCEGDSGSPLLNQHGELVGIASFGGETAGKTCGDPQFLAFTDIAPARTWATPSSPKPSLQESPFNDKPTHSSP